MTQAMKTKKIYFFIPEITTMLVFVHPTGNRKIHARCWSNVHTLCRKEVEGTIVYEAEEKQLCARCLHNMYISFNKKFSSREMQPFGVTCLVDTETVVCMNMHFYVYAEYDVQAKELVVAHLHNEISNIKRISQVETFTDFSNIKPETISFIN